LWVHHFEDIFYLVEEHDLLGAVHLGPVAQQAKNNLKFPSETYRDRFQDRQSHLFC
jgi:hypothetical protein